MVGGQYGIGLQVRQAVPWWQWGAGGVGTGWGHPEALAFGRAEPVGAEGSDGKGCSIQTLDSG